MAKRTVIGPVPDGHVVEEFKIGNTRCRICDDYCRNKTPEDVEKILDRVAKIAYPALLRVAIANGEIDVPNRRGKEEVENAS